MTTNPNFKLPQLGPVPVVDLKTGKSSGYFQSVWTQLTDKVTGFFVDLAAIQAQLTAQQLALSAVQAQQAAQIVQIQNALAQAAAAQSTANTAQTSADGGAVPTARSGSGQASVILTTNGAWVVGPVFVLPTVTAGDLTIPGTGPLGIGSTTGLDASGEYRITENGVDIGFAGTWSAYVNDEFGNLTVINETIDAANAYVSARVAGGSVSYGLDFRRTFGLGALTFDGYLYTRRA